jgi:hypothetical protein
MAGLTVCASTLHTLLDKSHTDEVDDGSIILIPDQAQRIGQFRNQIHLSKTDRDRYEICVRTRNEPLNEHTGGQLLVAASPSFATVRNRPHSAVSFLSGLVSLIVDLPTASFQSLCRVHWVNITCSQGIESKCHVALKTVALHGTAGLRGRSSMCKRVLCLDLLQPPDLTDQHPNQVSVAGRHCHRETLGKAISYV